MRMMFSLPLLLALASQDWSFEQDAPGAPAAGIEVVTGKNGPAGTWKVEQAGGTRVLAQTRATPKESALALVKGPPLEAVLAEARVKTLSGVHTLGLVWRYQDADNHYLFRAQTEPGNLSLIKVEKGTQTRLAALDTQKVMGKEWFRVRIVHKGADIKLFLNDRVILEAKDRTFAKGRVGLWTEGDTTAYFDDLRVEAQR